MASYYGVSLSFVFSDAGRGRFAEVWKAKLQQDSKNSKIVSVKVFRLPNYGAWRQEKEILSER